MIIRKILKYTLIFVFILSHARGQTYTVGDTISNFSLEICENGDGIWEYHEQGSGKVVWLNLFTSW